MDWRRGPVSSNNAYNTHLPFGTEPAPLPEYFDLVRSLPEGAVSIEEDAPIALFESLQGKNLNSMKPILTLGGMGIDNPHTLAIINASDIMGRKVNGFQTGIRIVTSQELVQ